MVEKKPKEEEEKARVEDLPGMRLLYLFFFFFVRKGWCLIVWVWCDSLQEKPGQLLIVVRDLV